MTKKPVTKIITGIVEKHNYRPENLIPMLQEIQETYGYLPKETMQELARLTRIPLNKIYGVITFYAQFYLTRRGKNIIRACRGTACHVRGSETVRETIEKTLNIKDGETTPDYKFSLETVACLGACALAPVMVVNNVYYGKMVSQKVESVLKKCK